MFEEQDTRIVVPPSVYKELKKQKHNMKRYIKSKLIKIKDKNK
jgi:rRNA-processing protein FCF1